MSRAVAAIALSEMGYAHRLMRGTFTRLCRVVGALLAVSLLLTACDSGTATETSVVSSNDQTTTSDPGTTTTAGSSAATTTTSAPTVIASNDLDLEVVERLAAQVTELITATEQVRGLPFLTQPTVTILSPEELEARVRAELEEELDPEDLEIESRALQLLGLLQPGVDYEKLILDLYGEQVAGFYDGDTGEMVIGGQAADLSPYTKTIVVHELIHALTDQHFIYHDDYQAMADEMRYEELSAFQALIEGDATYFQFVYIQELPLAEQLAMATEALEIAAQATITASVPDWIMNDLAFPYENGQQFVQALVDAGGIAAVDAAYLDRPNSTEVIMHPSRYAGGEIVADVVPVDLTIEGYETYETASYGEWGLRLLLSESAGPGVAAQAANGWGGDSYQVLYDDDDIVFALAYKGDSEDDAFELADALINLVSVELDLGEGIADGGGVSFTAEDGRFAYLDRIGDGFIFVLSTDAAAGAAAADQMRVP